MVRAQIRWFTWTWHPTSFGRSLTRISRVSVDLSPILPSCLSERGMHSGSDKKVLCQALSKLFLPPETDDDDKVRTLKLLVHNLRTRRPPRDASALAALIKFDSALSKRFEKQLEDFGEAEYRQLQSLQELFEFLDEIVPLDEDDDDEEDAPTSKKRAARKRRSESVTTDGTSTTDEWARTPRRGKGGKARSKCGPPTLLGCRGCVHLSPYRRRRTSQSDEDDDNENTVEGSPALPTRSMPRRAA